MKQYFFPKIAVARKVYFYRIFHRRNFPGGTFLGGIFLGGIYRSRIEDIRLWPPPLLNFPNIYQLILKAKTSYKIKAQTIDYNTSHSSALQIAWNVLIRMYVYLKKSNFQRGKCLVKDTPIVWPQERSLPQTKKIRPPIGVALVSKFCVSKFEIL